MARILIRCRIFDKAIPTGLTTNMIKSDTVDNALLCVARGFGNRASKSVSLAFSCAVSRVALRHCSGAQRLLGNDRMQFSA
jgi:hypothetical protein